MEIFHYHNFFHHADMVWKKQRNAQVNTYFGFEHNDNDDYEDADLYKEIEKRWKNLSPKPGNPLKFIDWFYSNGAVLFVEYFQKEVKGSINVFQQELDALMKLQRGRIKRVLRLEVEKQTDIGLLITYLQNILKRVKNYQPVYICPSELHNDVFVDALQVIKDEINSYIEELMLSIDFREGKTSANNFSAKLRDKLLANIYEMGIEDYSFIDTTQTTFETFKACFLNTTDNTKFVVINCNQNEAAVILDKMKELGFRIVYELLEEKQLIRTSSGKHLTADYISKAISVASKKGSPKTLHSINLFFHNLKNDLVYLEKK